MSKLEQFINQKREREGSQTLTGITLRVSEPIRVLIDEVSASLESSRQEVLMTMIEDGLDRAVKLLAEAKGPELERQSAFHILNTNKAHTDEDQEAMLAEGIAAAFYDPWYLNINRIKANDWVFLYQNGKGIIAYGQGTGQTLERAHRGTPKACRYQKLKGFTVLQHPMSAADVRKLLGRNVIFLRTMVGVPDGQRLLDAVSSTPKV